MSQLKKREKICPSFAFLFYLGPQQIGRCPPPSNPLWGRLISLLSLRTQMLISSRNTLTDTLRNNVLPAFWASLSPIKLTQNQPSQIGCVFNQENKCWWKGKVFRYVRAVRGGKEYIFSWSSQKEEWESLSWHSIQLNIFTIRKNFVNWTGLLQVAVSSLSLKMF